MSKLDRPARIKRIYGQLDTVFPRPGSPDRKGPLRKVAVVALITNPYAGLPFSADLGELVRASEEIGHAIGSEAADLLGEPPQSYGKAAVAGVLGEQEHANATITGVFGDAIRAAVGGGTAWITSVTKVSAPDAAVDVPLAFKDEIWVRSHYDAIHVSVPGGPLPDEIAVICALANRGRIDARLGGLSCAEATARLSSIGTDR